MLPICDIERRISLPFMGRVASAARRVGKSRPGAELERYFPTRLLPRIKSGVASTLPMKGKESYAVAA